MSDDPHVVQARARKAEADADFEAKLAEAREKMERKMLVNEIVRRSVSNQRTCQSCGRAECPHANRRLCEIDRQYRSGKMARAFGLPEVP